MHYIKLQGGRQMTLECSDANHVPAIHKKMPTYASPQATAHHGASLFVNSLGTDRQIYVQSKAQI